MVLFIVAVFFCFSFKFFFCFRKNSLCYGWICEYCQPELESEKGDGKSGDVAFSVFGFFQPWLNAIDSTHGLWI